MEPIYGQNGKVVAWRNGKNLHALNGTHAAVLNGDNLYGHRGQHLGGYTSGLFRDHTDTAVAFEVSAKGGPLLLLASIPPIPPIPAIPSTPAIPSLPQLAPLPLLTWSAMNGERYLKQ